MENVIVCEQYSASTFRRWTDGPKYLLDTKNLSDRVDLTYVLSVFTVKNEEAMKIELDRFTIGSVGTFFFINDELMAGIAKHLRPDLDFRLLVLQ